MKHLGCCLLLVVLCVVAPVRADDLFDPPWQGTGGLETHQGWEFTNDLDLTYVNNSYGSPTLTSDFDSQAWMDTFEGRQGVMYFDGVSDDWIYLDIPNADNGNPRKEIWMQITYFAHDGFPGLDYYIDGWGGETTGFGSGGVGPDVLASTANGDWVYEAIHWVIEPNPMGETITLASSFYEAMYIDQIHIDTICIPEPGSLVLLGLGALTLLRRR